MEGIRKKLLVGLVTLALVLIANVALWAVIASSEYKGIANTGAWTPMPGLTSTMTLLADDPQPTQTSTLYASPTNTKDPAKNCTHSTTYWESHPEAWPGTVIIANFTYTKDDITTVIEAQSSEVDAVLFIQLHTAFLNAVSGADYDKIYNTIIDAANWLNLHPVGGEISQPDQQTAISFVKILEDYNDGQLGPGPCIGDATPIPAESTSLPTAMVSLTATFRPPAMTATAVQATSQPHPHVPPKNTNTPHPSQPPPTQEPPPSPVPTSIPPTQPVPTSVPPTQPLPTSVPPTPLPPTQAPMMPSY